MGIPLYFKFLTQKYPNIIEKYVQTHEYNSIYFDLNGLIHPCCAMARKTIITDSNYCPDKLYREMFNNIKKKILEKCLLIFQGMFI